MEQSDSSGSDDDDSDASDASDDSDDDEIEQKRAASIKASAVALPSAADLMAGGGSGGGIYHNPYEQKEIHTKRKMHDNEDNVIFKKVQGKKKVYGQGAKPKTNSSVARSWTSGGGGGQLLPPQVARGRANAVTEDTAAWNVTKQKMAPTGLYSKQFDGSSSKPMGLEIIDRAAGGGGSGGGS